MSYPYIIQGSAVTVVIDNKPHTIAKGQLGYDKLVQAIKDGDWDKVKDVIEPKKVVLTFGEGNISVEGAKLFWKGIELHNSLTKRIVQMIEEDFPVEPMVNFMENLMNNPSKRSVTELYGFLEQNTLPITPDGYFLAYKKVKEDYTDWYSGTVLNKPAQYLTEEDHEKIKEASGKVNEVTVEVIDGETVISTPRNFVDDDQNRTCSNGLHFCSKDYLGAVFNGARYIVVKINPADVVSIPTDYGNSKGRCCAYTIVDEIDKDKADEAFAKAVQEKAEKEASTLTEEDRKNIAAIYNEVKKQKVAEITETK